MARYGGKMRYVPTITASHSIFVHEEGEVRLKRGDALKVGDEVVAPRRIRLPETAPRRIDLLAGLHRAPGAARQVWLRGPAVEAFLRAKVEAEYADRPQLTEPRVELPLGLRAAHLGRCGLAADLAQRFAERGEARGVEARELAAAGIGRDRAAEPGAARRDEGAALARLAEAVGLELHDHRDRERVVERRHVDVFDPDAGLAERRLLRRRDVVVQVVHLARPPVADVVPATDTEYRHRAAREITRSFGGGDEHRDAAVGVTTAVQQAQRVDDHARRLVIVDRDRLPEPERAGTHRRMLALYHRDRAEVARGGAVAMHVPPGVQRVRAARADETVDAPIAVAEVAVATA